MLPRRAAGPRKGRLPIPQHEFGFAPEVFNLISESTLDGDRIAREREAFEAARRHANAAQVPMFNPQPRKP